jgi:hypothetical protein
VSARKGGSGYGRLRLNRPLPARVPNPLKALRLFATFHSKPRMRGFLGRSPFWRNLTSPRVHPARLELPFGNKKRFGMLLQESQSIDKPASYAFIKKFRRFFEKFVKSV